MKRFICTALALAMLISILPVSVSAQAPASTIYLKPNEITLAMAESTPNSYFCLTYHSNNGTNSITMTKNSSEYYSAVVNSDVATLEFILMSSDGSMLWNAMCEYEDSSMNCASFSENPQLVNWCDYLTQILSDGNVLYFTPNEDWLMTYNRFSVCFSGANYQNTYVEMTAVGDGSYAVPNRSDATRYVFCALRATATSPDQTTLRSVTVSKPSSQFNHYTLSSGMSGGASGEWSFKETPGGGSEEIPPEIILPDENAQVSWGYSENRIEGYTTFREALALYAGETIYIKLIKELSLEETITIVDGKYQIDLSGFNITSSAEEPFVLQYADVKIVNSEGNTGVTATTNTDKYMFRVENSVFEIAGGYFETQGAGIICELTSNSKVTINGGLLHSGSESVVSVADGKLTVKGGNLLGFPSFAHILYTGSDYNNNIIISNIESNESTIYLLENISILPDDLGVKDRVIVSLVPGGNAENIILSGQVYYIDFNRFLTFQELDLVVKVRNGEEYTMPDCTLVPDLGSVFECWKDISDNMLYQVDQVIIPQRDMRFLASWKPSEIISVSFDANGGSGNVDALLSTSSAPFVLPDCVFTPPYGKVFDTWQIGDDLYSAGETVTLYTDTIVKAIWKDGVAVTYKANGGMGDDIVIFVESEKNITLPENTFTAPENKTFKAWQINGKEYPVGKQIKIIESTEIYAVWNEGYKVTYLPNGGTGKTITEKYTEATHILLAENTFTHPDGIPFKCWEIDGEEYLPGQVYFVDKNTDILAKWNTDYTIKYVYTYTVSDGTKLTKTYEDMALDGVEYTFRLPSDIFNNIYSNHEPEYWKDESGSIYQFGENNYIDRDITVELVYKEFYKIQIDPRNDIDTTEQYTKYKGDEFVFPDVPQNIPEGYAFDGWQSVFDGECYYPGDTMTVEKHIGFYAVWVKFIELSKIESIFKDGVYVGEEYILPEKTRSLKTGELVDIIWDVVPIYIGSDITLTDNVLKIGQDVPFILYVVAKDANADETDYCKEISLEGSLDYPIRTPQDLQAFSDMVNSGMTEKNAVLLSDIDMTGYTLIPIGKYSYDTAYMADNSPYKGTFDGKGHVISNLTVNASETFEAGLFGRITSGGVIKNLGVINATINGTSESAGVIAGELEGATLTKVFAAGDIDIYTTNEHKGGIAGEAVSSSFTNVFTTYNAFADGTQSSVTNSFYMADVKDSNSIGEYKTETQFKSGEIAYLLGNDFGQKIDTDYYPVFGGDTVYKVLYCDGKTAIYSNIYENIDHVDQDTNHLCDVCEMYLGTEFVISNYDALEKTATILIPEAGTYTVIFADYDDTRFVNCELVTVVVTEPKAYKPKLTMNFNLDKNDKIMLMSDITKLAPKCEVYIIE